MGRNGAGKSTTMKALMGLLRAARGADRASAGSDIAARRRTASRRLGLGYVPEDRRIFTDLTVMENLDVGRQPPRAGRRLDAERASRCSRTSARCRTGRAAA